MPPRHSLLDLVCTLSGSVAFIYILALAFKLV